MNERIGAWIMVGGATAMLLSFALGWSSYAGARGDNPFHYPLTGGLAWLLVIGAGVVAGMRLRGFPMPSRASMAMMPVADIGLALMVVCVVRGGRTIEVAEGASVTVHRGPGMWLALVAAAVTAAGATLLALSHARSGTPPRPPTAGA